MNIQKEDLGSSRFRLTVTPDIEEWQKFVKQAEDSLAKRKIEGFRPGKAPSDVIRSHFGEETVFDEAFGLAFPSFYQEALEQAELKPVTNPTMESLDKNLAGPKFTLIVITMPQVVLGDYAQIRIKKEEVKVEDKEVDDMLAQLQRQRATFKIVERPIIKGDLAEIDFEGLIDGKPMEGGVSKNHPLIVGDGLFVAGFEENLIGLKKGDEKTFEITFPADFAKAELAGKKGAFTVKVNAVKEVNLPSLDNAFAQLFGQPDLAALSNDIKKFIQSQKENELAKKYQDTLIDELIAGSKIELPAELVEEEVHSMLEEAKEQAAHLKLTWPEYLARSQQTEQSFHEQLYKLAERRIKAGLIIDQIGNLEKIGVSPEEVEHEISRIKQSSPEQEKEVEAIYQKGTAARRRLEIALTGQKTLNTLLQKVLL